jgi:hypothetical protein
MPESMGSNLPAGGTAPSSHSYGWAKSNDFRLLDARVQKLSEPQAQAAKFNQFNTRHRLHLESVAPVQEAVIQSRKLSIRRPRESGGPGQATEIPRFSLSRKRRGGVPLHPEHAATLLRMVEPQ